MHGVHDPTIWQLTERAEKAIRERSENQPADNTVLKTKLPCRSASLRAYARGTLKQLITSWI